MSPRSWPATVTERTLPISPAHWLMQTRPVRFGRKAERPPGRPSCEPVLAELCGPLGGREIGEGCLVRGRERVDCREMIGNLIAVEQYGRALAVIIAEIGTVQAISD